jgi:acetoin utilization deacetylase AcuC-like enzyme
MRPPGHHALTETAMGFCLFNNVAVAARHALGAGASRVWVLDWDVHHGNGTNDIFHASRDVLFTSLHQAPLYPGSGPLQDVGSGEGEGFTVNLPVPPGAGEDEWLPLVEQVALPIARQFEPDLILLSTGFDAHRADPLAQCTLEEGSFAEMARHVMALARERGVPVGATLEGGYDLDALARSTAATLEVLASENSAAPRAFDGTARTEEAARVLGRFWDL